MVHIASSEKLYFPYFKVFFDSIFRSDFSEGKCFLSKSHQGWIFFIIDNGIQEDHSFSTFAIFS